MKRFVLGLLMLASGTAYGQASLLLKNATVINGDAAVAPRKASILITGGRIEKIFEEGTPLPDTAKMKTLDCTGKFLSPGMIDAHVHLGTLNMRQQQQIHRQTDSILANMVRHGITSVRDMAGDAIFLAEYSRATATDQLMGPSIFYAAQFAGPDYFALMRKGSRNESGLGTTPWYRAITPETDLRLAIAEAKGAGATGIKIYNDLSAKQIAAITKEAHKQGMMAWSHAAVFPAKPAAGVSAGVNSMSHAADMAFQQIPGDTLEISKAWHYVMHNFVLDTAVQLKLLQQMKAKHIFLDPTIYHATNNKLNYALTVVRLAHQVGVQVVSGTDWIYPTKNEPVPLEKELLLLVNQCGFTALEAMQCATWNAAQVIGVSDRGQIREGAHADLLITNVDPRTNISALFSPEWVFKSGVVQK